MIIKNIINYVAGVEKSVETIAIGFFDTIKKLEDHAAERFAAAVKHSEEANVAKAKRDAANDESTRASLMAGKIRAFVS